MDRIFFLDENSAADPSISGGKAAALARLTRQGLPIPPGFVVTSSAFDENGLRPEAQAALLSAAKKLQGRWAGKTFAVRSSASVEDGIMTSFAGGFDTILNVPLEALDAAVQKVWMSASGERAHRYAAAHGLESQVRMSVLVQGMVRADAAGVLFTIDPLTGDSVMVGEAVPGTGEALVAGKADPARFRLTKPDGRYTALDEAASAFLPEAAARKLFHLAAAIEQETLEAQDIEWARAADTLYILQSRPVTALPAPSDEDVEWNASLVGDFFWTTTNFGEAMPEVMTPLTWSLMRTFFEVNSLGLDDDRLPMGGNIGGRLYMNLSPVFSLFSALGFSRSRILALAEDTFGKLPDGVEIPYDRMPRWTAWRKFFPAAIRRARLVNGLKKDLDAYVHTSRESVSAAKSALASADSPAALKEIWRRIARPMVVRSMLILAAGTSDYKNRSRSLRAELIRLVGEADANALLSGHPDSGLLASLGPLVGLARLAAGKIERAAYLAEYGHRGPSEFELSVPTPDENDGLLNALLAGSATDADAPQLLLDRQRAMHRDAWDRLARRYPGKKKRLEARLAALARAAQIREAVRSEVVRQLRLARDYAQRAGALSGIGSDVFFLEEEEIGRLLDGERAVIKAIQHRKRRHARLSRLPPYPPLIRGRFDPENWAADPNRPTDFFQPGHPAGIPLPQDGAAVVGFPGAPGVVAGRVRVLAQPDDGASLETGEILVARTTNVGWTPLFPRAAAVVTDIGAPLSHAAIVARELGVPAVVGTGLATARLKTGDLVRVDGGAGRVWLLEEASA